METKAIVVAIDGECAIVRVDRKSACDGCHRQSEGRGCAMCTMMGDKAAIDSRADNSIGAKIGDTVLLESVSGRVLGYAALVFLVPILASLLFYWFGCTVTTKAMLRYLFMLIGFIGSFAFLRGYSREVIAKRCDVVIKSVLQNANEDTNVK